MASRRKTNHAPDPLQRHRADEPADHAPWSLLGDVETNVPELAPRGVDQGETLPVTKVSPGALSQRFLHAHWWSQRQRLFHAMELAGCSDKSITRVRECGTLATVEKCTTSDEYRIRGSKCRHRFCRRCGKSTQMNVADNLYDMIKAAPGRCSHITLTLKHRHEALPDTMQRLYKCFKTMRNHRVWKRYVTGGAAFCQMHVSNADGCWHVHFHLIAENKYMKQKVLSLLWHRITGDSTNVWIERIHNAADATREACRYVASPIDKETAKSILHLAEAIEATKGRRLCFTFGSWRGQKLHAKRADEDTREWVFYANLGDLIQHAETGQERSRKILEILFTRQTPNTGPPTLFHKPLYVRNVESQATG